jgi:hypothetical protein
MADEFSISIMAWVFHRGCRLGDLGLIPSFLRSDDPRPAREQLADGYGFAGGWSPMRGFKLGEGAQSLLYPEDPPLPVLAETCLRDEIIRVYECAWVAVFQPDGSFEVARMN